MRFINIISVFILLLFNGCITEKNKDVSEVNKLLLVTDSLLNVIQNQYNYTSENFYLLADDSLRVDSLAQGLNLPDSLGFYQYLELNINEFNEIFIQTQQEIYFAKDQLSSLKNELLNSEISKSEFLMETSDVKDMVRFLKERVDSNIYLINQKYNIPFFSIKDSVQK
ncbi:MAG: hypothetical protein KOO66_11495 [Bacteroidales bacterium]|nr:hypothetical protein [Bacteroidales bacterium]